MKVLKGTSVKISERELQVLGLISRGKTNAQISIDLFISPNTVKSHKKNLFHKFNAHNTALLVRKGFESGHLCHDSSEKLHLVSNFKAV